QRAQVMISESGLRRSSVKIGDMAKSLRLRWEYLLSVKSFQTPWDSQRVKTLSQAMLLPKVSAEAMIGNDDSKI
ncbi:hypothetical protein, partial [Rhodobacter viridis]|uniref:hypothetical protein n=1 Tax=Rhodobacter viridis TaxID=1054202 RepID=UPI001C653EFD